MNAYNIVLLVYVLLWITQMVIGHMTHSLLILTDSYINIYRILDISLGIINLRTQRRLRRSKDNLDESKEHASSISLLGRICTYRFERLYLLGSFINGIFLAALLMSAAIEGIQTCVHEGHRDIGPNPILHRNELTIPALLIGFAVVGALMQWCSRETHRIGDEKIKNMNWPPSPSYSRNRIKNDIPEELNVESLNQKQVGTEQIKFESFKACQSNRRYPLYRTTQLGCNKEIHNKPHFRPSNTRSQYREPETKITIQNLSLHRSLDQLPFDTCEENNVSLRSLRIDLSETHSPQGPLSKNRTKTESNDGCIENNSPKSRIFYNPNSRDEQSTKMNHWRIVGDLASPVALALGAIIYYFSAYIKPATHLIREVADAGLTVTVVILLYISLYRPLKEAGLVLLQTAPDQIDVGSLKSDLRSVSSLVVEVADLHVWSINSKSGPIATCKLVFRRGSVKSKNHLITILRDVELKLLERDIQCSTVEPHFK